MNFIKIAIIVPVAQAIRQNNINLCILLTPFLITGIILLSAEKTIETNQVPTKDKVGANKVHDSVFPVKAPFVTKVFRKPVFKDFSVNIVETGAKTDKKATRAIQFAIDNVNRHGGGIVIVPQGNWLTGRLILKSNVDLNLEEGAELHFSGSIRDYSPVVFTPKTWVAGNRNMKLDGAFRLTAPKSSEKLENID